MGLFQERARDSPLGIVAGRVHILGGGNARPCLGKTSSFEDTQTVGLSHLVHHQRQRVRERALHILGTQLCHDVGDRLRGLCGMLMRELDRALEGRDKAASNVGAVCQKAVIGDQRGGIEVQPRRDQGSASIWRPASAPRLR